MLDEKDCAFYKKPDRYNALLLQPGDFVVYLPGELYAPKCMAGERPETISKIVFKIQHR